MSFEELGDIEPCECRRKEAERRLLAFGDVSSVRGASSGLFQEEPNRGVIGEQRWHRFAIRARPQGSHDLDMTTAR